MKIERYTNNNNSGWLVETNEDTYNIECNNNYYGNNDYYDIYNCDEIIWTGRTLEECLVYLDVFRQED